MLFFFALALSSFATGSGNVSISHSETPRPRPGATASEAPAPHDGGSHQRVLPLSITFIINVVVFIFLVITIVSMLHYRYNYFNNALNRVSTRNHIPIRVKDGLPAKLVTIIERETQREVSIKVVPEMRKIPGWGLPPTKIDGEKDKDEDVFSFRSFIIYSFAVIEATAVRRSAALARRRNQNARVYIYHLKRRLDLREDVCTNFIDVYEKARFCNQVITQREYKVFMKHMNKLKTDIESAPVIHPLDDLLDD